MLPVGGDGATMLSLLHRVLVYACHFEGLRKGWNMHRGWRLQASPILLPEFDPILHDGTTLVYPRLHSCWLRHAVIRGGSLGIAIHLVWIHYAIVPSRRDGSYEIL